MPEWGYISKARKAFYIKKYSVTCCNSENSGDQFETKFFIN